MKVVASKLLPVGLLTGLLAAMTACGGDDSNDAARTAGGSGASTGAGAAVSGGSTGQGAGGTGAGGGGGSVGAGAAASGGDAGAPGGPPVPLTGPGHVTIAQAGGRWALQRDGVDYVVRGVGGQHQLAKAQEAGANSTRTWGSENALQILDEAAALGMTVTLGIWLSHDAGSYESQQYKEDLRAEVTNLLSTIKNHPALLVWAIGNELNISASTVAAWQTVEDLASLIKEQDPHHPTMTVLADAPADVISMVVTHAPSIDILGVNSYGGLAWIDGKIAGSAWSGPYLVTEWGPDGHWEVPSTSWGRPIEQTSADKAKTYADRYAIIQSAQRALGGYVFLWGQKQERTPTWYSMFVETMPALGLAGEACPTVDAITQAYRGSGPANRAPHVTALQLAGKTASENVAVSPGASVTAAVTATDPEGDPLSVVWEVLPEPNQLGVGGSWEGRPPAVAGAISGSGLDVTVSVSTPGQYRVFAYVLDGRGRVGTANLPFLVQ